MLRRDIRYQAAIIQDHHVLLLRCAEPDGTTFWVSPGGGREGEETAEACVCREVFEETSLTVAVERFLFAERNSPGHMCDYLHSYLCRVVAGTAAPGIEPEFDTAEHTNIREVGWFDLRAPASWPALILTHPFTCGWLHKLRATLRYS